MTNEPIRFAAAPRRLQLRSRETGPTDPFDWVKVYRLRCGRLFTYSVKAVWPAARCALLLKVCKLWAQKEQDAKVFMCPLSIYLLKLEHENGLKWVNFSSLRAACCSCRGQKVVCKGIKYHLPGKIGSCIFLLTAKAAWWLFYAPFQSSPPALNFCARSVRYQSNRRVKINEEVFHFPLCCISCYSNIRQLLLLQTEAATRFITMK